MEPLNPEVTGQMLQIKAEEVPDKKIVTFEYDTHGDESLTYSQLFTNAAKLAAWLLERGVEKGDRVAVFMRNYPEFLYAILGSNIIGAIWVALDPRLVGESLAYQIKDSQSKVIVTTTDLLPALGKIEGFRGAIVFADKPELPPTPDSVLAAIKDNVLLVPMEEIKQRPFTPVEQKGLPGDPCQIMYTSGTTGNPKGVLWRNRRMDILVDLLWHYTPEDILYTGLSLSHANSHSVTLMPSLYREIPSVYSVRFARSRIWDICRKYGCTTYSCLGGMINMIYAMPERADDGDNPVKVVISAGTPAAIWESFEKRFKVKILEWYGALDGGCVTIKQPGEGPIGSMGKPLELFRVRVIDESGNDRPPRAPGELISQPVIGEAKVEYYGKEKESQEKTLAGWHRSGDIVYQDEEGWLYFCNRKGDELRKYGEFIQPSLIEKILCEHPAVAEVCVYGVPSKAGAPGESDVVVAIAPVEPVNLDIKVIMDWCKDRLPKSHVPDYLQVVDEIPKTISQRPLTRLLKVDFRERRGRIYEV
ncbi:MAG: AMP-binding protein [Deltaproteobacteria bacterium]|nr:AMP-binding protein [Deltaproteobacteria bacterium]